MLAGGSRDGGRRSLLARRDGDEDVPDGPADPRAEREEVDRSDGRRDRAEPAEVSLRESRSRHDRKRQRQREEAGRPPELFVDGAGHSRRHDEGAEPRREQNAETDDERATFEPRAYAARTTGPVTARTVTDPVAIWSKRAYISAQ